jgi:hypothetical protein
MGLWYHTPGNDLCVVVIPSSTQGIQSGLRWRHLASREKPHPGGNHPAPKSSNEYAGCVAYVDVGGSRDIGSPSCAAQASGPGRRDSTVKMLRLSNRALPTHCLHDVS